MYEKLYLVSAAQLDKIKEAKEPALDYTELYNAVIKSKEEEVEVVPVVKLKLLEWLSLYNGESS
jgi:hypothetical protein